MACCTSGPGQGKYTLSTSIPESFVGALIQGSTLADHTIHALDAASGKLLWTYATEDAIYGGGAVAGGLLYVGSSDGRMYAFGTQSPTALTLESFGTSVASVGRTWAGTVFGAFVMSIAFVAWRRRRWL